MLYLSIRLRNLSFAGVMIVLYIHLLILPSLAEDDPFSGDVIDRIKAAKSRANSNRDHNPPIQLSLQHPAKTQQSICLDYFYKSKYQTLDKENSLD